MWESAIISPSIARWFWQESNRSFWSGQAANQQTLQWRWRQEFPGVQLQPQRCVCNVVRKFVETGQINECPRPGWPRMAGSGEDHVVIREAYAESPHKSVQRTSTKDRKSRLDTHGCKQLGHCEAKSLRQDTLLIGQDPELHKRRVCFTPCTSASLLTNSSECFEMSGEMPGDEWSLPSWFVILMKSVGYEKNLMNLLFQVRPKGRF